MKLLLLFLVLISLYACVSPQQSPLSRTAVIHQSVSEEIDSLHTFLTHVLLPLAQQSSSTDSLQEAFLHGRRQYKKIEHWMEYFMPTTSRLVNGAPLNEIELAESQSFEPGGFQVLEEVLFPAWDETNRETLVLEVHKLCREVKRYQLLWKEMGMTDAHVFDATRLQVFRIITQGITGFDTPASGSSLAETAISLETIQRQLHSYYDEQTENPTTFINLNLLLGRAIGYLHKNNQFDTFDRLYFIREFANPITTELLNWQQEKHIDFVQDIRPLRADAKTLFEIDAFNPNFYTNYPSEHATAEKIALGKRLFYDPVLSANRQRSCASCHQPDKAFTDGLAKNVSFQKNSPMKRNTPTLINVAFQNGHFYDLRTQTLESQVKDVVENLDEMHGNVPQSCRTLQVDATYLALFRKAFPDMGDSIQPQHLQNALASYERSLVSFQSRFDQYMRGDDTQMNMAEKQGFNLFMGKARCGTCHFMPLFNGTVPPGFTKTESEVLGVPATATNKKLDADLGRYAIAPFPSWKHAFKTTTLRNVALTAPYMHNGVYQTLEEVIDFYEAGGGSGLGLSVPNQTLSPEKLKLSVIEKKALIAFLHTLTDVPVEKPPVSPPSLAVR